jgi:hypothetical protein
VIGRSRRGGKDKITRLKVKMQMAASLQLWLAGG